MNRLSAILAPGDIVVDVAAAGTRAVFDEAGDDGFDAVCPAAVAAVEGCDVGLAAPAAAADGVAA